MSAWARREEGRRESVCRLRKEVTKHERMHDDSELRSREGRKKGRKRYGDEVEGRFFD